MATAMMGASSAIRMAMAIPMPTFSQKTESSKALGSSRR
jgi:hypothetical protein